MEIIFRDENFFRQQEPPSTSGKPSEPELCDGQAKNSRAINTVKHLLVTTVAISAETLVFRVIRSRALAHDSCFILGIFLR